MSDKYCCCVWESLSKELKEAKVDELEQVTGVPKSVFAPVYKVLDKMGTFCPVCGSGLTSDAVKQQPTPKLVRTPELDVVPVKPVARIKCPYCKGQGLIGEDKNGIEIKCARCLGQGYHDHNTMNEMNSPKLDPERAQKLVQMQTELQEGKRGEVAE